MPVVILLEENRISVDPQHRLTINTRLIYKVFSSKAEALLGESMKYIRTFCLLPSVMNSLRAALEEK